MTESSSRFNRVALPTLRPEGDVRRLTRPDPGRSYRLAGHPSETLNGVSYRHVGDARRVPDDMKHAMERACSYLESSSVSALPRLQMSVVDIGPVASVFAPLVADGRLPGTAARGEPLYVSHSERHRRSDRTRVGSQCGLGADPHHLADQQTGLRQPELHLVHGHASVYHPSASTRRACRAESPGRPSRRRRQTARGCSR